MSSLLSKPLPANPSHQLPNFSRELFYVDSWLLGIGLNKEPNVDGSRGVVRKAESS